MAKDRSLKSFDRIVSDPAILDGRPCIKGTRLTVHRILNILAIDLDRAHLSVDYPQLSDEDIRQALAYAASLLDDRAARRYA